MVETETVGGVHANQASHYKRGTVGPAIPPTRTKLAEAGEILVHGPTVMMGYHNLPDEMAAVLDEEGWLRTGDVGQLDTQGFLTITDRKKELIKKSGGKYVAPHEIENAMRTIRGVAQTAVRRWPSVLRGLDHARPGGRRDDRAGRAGRHCERTSLPRMKLGSEGEGCDRARVGEQNARLASYETIKDYRSVPGEWATELTSTFKLRRRRVAECFGGLRDETLVDAP